MELQGRDLTLALSGEDVKLLHSELGQLNIAIPREEIARAAFGPGTEAAVARLQKQQGLPVTGIVDAATSRTIGKLADVLRPAALDTATFSVSGRVYDAARASVGTLALRVVDKNAGPDVVMAEGKSNANGDFSIEYPTDTFVRAGKSAPDLQVQALLGETVVGFSDVYYDAPGGARLDIQLDSRARASLPSEYEALSAAAGKYCREGLGALRESEGRSDITFLANKTGWDARAVALAALGERFSAESKIPAMYFYALFRAGMPAEDKLIFLADAARLTAIWRDAIGQGLLPAAAEKAIPDILGQFQAIGARKMLAEPMLPGTSAFSEILANAGLHEEEQRNFSQLYLAHRGDLEQFWKRAAHAFGEEKTAVLQFAGKMAFLTLNNAQLMQALTAAVGEQLTDPRHLVEAGFHDPASWLTLLNDTVQIPDKISGLDRRTQRLNYADYLSALLRLSYPTACMGQLVQRGAFRIASAEAVGKFLTEHQQDFAFGSQPVEQYAAQRRLDLEPAVVEGIRRLHRVHQISARDSEMSALLDADLDSAWRIVQFDRAAFATEFGAALGGEAAATQIHAKAVQVHGAVLNVTVSYLAARNAIVLGKTAPAPLLDVLAAGAPQTPTLLVDPTPAPEHADDVIAYATLESLFGSMDFCRCPACRSILSPAAYLVDLLLFTDKAAGGLENAQHVLLQRRPDIQYLPLTCENTNTPMPYIDVVNEILEYYIANGAKPLSLQDYAGHDTAATGTEDLMASPLYVLEAAYDLLRDAWFPPPLPFDRSLETLRAYYRQLGLPLAGVMEALRKSDDLERGGQPYGWRDILMEQLGLSRQQYRLLTDSTLTLQQIYGYPADKPDADIIVALSNAKALARRIGISYEELIGLLKTRFINPDSALVPKLQKLGVDFGALKALKEGTLSHADFLLLLPTGAGAPDAANYGGDIVAWVEDAANYARIMGIITLVDPTDASTVGNFDKLELRYAKPMANPADDSTRLGRAPFTRLLRFVCLWRKLGWTMEQTDIAICTLFGANAAPLVDADLGTVAALDAGFMRLLPRLGIVARTLDQLGLTPQRDLAALLACWSDIGTEGEGALYRTLFVNPSVRDQNPAFADNGYGAYLSDSAAKLQAHVETLRGAFNLTGDEFERICTALGYDANTALTLANISALFRRGWLARKLKLSVRELLVICALTGIDPFALPDMAAAAPALPAMSRLIALLQSLRECSLKSPAALYLIWNEDLGGKSAPDPAQLTELARALRGQFADINDQFAAAPDPGGDVLRARMTLVYGQEAADAFFAVLDDSAVYDTAYTHPHPVLEPALTALAPKLSYERFSHRLAHAGVLSRPAGAALQAVAAVGAEFQDAIARLVAQGSDRSGSFFARFAELKPLYDAYVASNAAPEQKRTALLAAFQPRLARLRKREQALQRLSTTAALDLTATRTLMDAASAPRALHAKGNANLPLLDDIVGVDAAGLMAQFYFRDTATGAVDLSVAAAVLDHGPGGANALPANPAPGSAISARWQGAFETPDAGFYNLIIEADAGATVTLAVDGTAQPLIRTGTVWRNQLALELTAGKLYSIALTVEKVKERVRLSWETPQRAREVIAARYLYADAALATFADACVGFLKASALLSGLGLTAPELTWLASDTDYQIGGVDGWLNALATRSAPSAAQATALLKPFTALLDYATIKVALQDADSGLLAVLRDPTAAAARSDSLLFTLTRWDQPSLVAILAHLGVGVAALSHFDTFRRVYCACCTVQRFGVPAQRLIGATTNEPGAGALRDFQAAMRARYDLTDWRDVIKPVNDGLRVMQRDALVAYILHQMREHPASAHIDTADKLFEYFLVDVEMECCMQTSRIRHALSSIQLFVERCLMNLEPRVSPAALNAEHWQWMKRYRVWEANRKVFLFPENWLEPELRDDKSPLYKEMESALLQADITDDAASKVLLNYLAGLADIAKLEPCGMFIEQKEAGAGDDIVHAVARGAGAKRKYHYRRYEYGYWTPWELIKLEIEDNPLVPVVWNHRLILVWVKILQETPLLQPAAGSTPAADPDLASIKMSQLKQNAKLAADSQAMVNIRAVLYWSEFYNGQWQAPMTSDPLDSVDLGWFPPQGSGAFRRANLRIGTDELDEQLRVTVYGKNTRSFLLYNTHSLPQQGGAVPASGPKYGRHRWFDLGAGSLTLKYRHAIPDIPAHELARTLFKPATDMLAIQPSHPLENGWDAPFFYGDRQYAFYVTTTEQTVLVKDYGGIGITPQPGDFEIPPLVVEKPPIGFPPKDWGTGGPIQGNPGVIDPSPIEHLIVKGDKIRQGLGMTQLVDYGGVSIGPTGAVNFSQFR
ncbi:neuraminidase-like domain-containing protein [Massilia sp. PWRC2]|uniref:neuraminidase-like domain-containing protein n=1 Tax=Massilia sp. PWRC2 TaxID=2804626 RepID=UPI003CECFB22